MQQQSQFCVTCSNNLSTSLIWSNTWSTTLAQEPRIKLNNIITKLQGFQFLQTNIWKKFPPTQELELSLLLLKSKHDKLRPDSVFFDCASRVGGSARIIKPMALS